MHLCNNCRTKFKIDYSTLECENNGASGSHTTSYTYTGTLVCPNCNGENDVSFDIEKVNDTGEILNC